MIHFAPEQVVPRVIELFESTCVKQFESLDQDIQLVARHSDQEALQRTFDGDELFYAHINAASDELETSLVISVPKAALDVTMPDLVKGLDNHDDFLVDWNLELANRLMGRLKNKLISHECILQMGIPEPFEAKQAIASEQQPGEAIAYHYSLKGLEFRCHLRVNRLNPEMTMEDHEDEDEDWFDKSELEHL